MPSIQSYAVGSQVNFPNDIAVGVNATGTPQGGFDGVSVNVRIGDANKPRAIESTVTQNVTLADGSTRQIDLPRISAEPKPDSTRASVGGTATFQATPLSSDPSLSIQPSVSAAVGTDFRGNVGATVQGAATVPELGAQVTGRSQSLNGDSRPGEVSVSGQPQGTGALNNSVLDANNRLLIIKP
jgi:hypothetical protein